MKANYSDRLIDNKMILTTLTKVEDTSRSTVYVTSNPELHVIVFYNQTALADYIKQNVDGLFGIRLIKEGKKYCSYNVALESGEEIIGRTIAEAFNIMNKDNEEPVIMYTDDVTGLPIIE
ncbi:hypothetical protein SHANETTE_71 [Bacillus phage Shanette]|uniref:Uncharacterized protein n=1 Tax=Bacillus phage Shanette TaxID=1296656 RepID=S5M509_9CAUD|nr:hypothetical protein AVV46_gp071 [Bacillus phage Shanette]AGR46971.1 hypothetical protein SHANETTE_71 [Bacillus phage Shanette]